MKNKNIRKLNNKGSALIIAVVVIGFVAILTTVLLYLATQNFQMKATDYSTRVSFYGAETPLEELRTQLVLDASEASQTAYKEVLLKYGAAGANTGGVRATEYQNKFMDLVEATWATRNNNAGTTDWRYGIENVLKAMNTTNEANYHVITTSGWNTSTMKCTTSGCAKHYHIVVDDLAAGVDRLERDDSESRMILRGIRVIYTEGSFSSIIATDLCIHVPAIEWNVEEYAASWDTDSTIDRKEVNFEEYVTYMNWTKQ